MAKPAQIASEIHMDTQNTAQVSVFTVWSSFVCFVIFVNQFEHKMPHLKKKREKKK